MMRGRFWTEEDDANLLDRRKAGERVEDIAKAMDRTMPAIASRIRHLSLSAEEREEAGRMKYVTRQPVIRMRIDHGRKHVAPVVPEDVLQEMIKRLTTPRSITAVLMGDPPFPATPTNPRVLA